eukprot:TRINITY_DN11212_c0_g1_i1.p2 TRINITY_DN11212_c0_g1~~TRINITY_DN11212_c0_g1_i1.p2  ORF type:complete len:170 (+),score=1.24 TRINITY_DN11212_c0_g1_i1:338-847(+)
MVPCAVGDYQDEGCAHEVRHQIRGVIPAEPGPAEGVEALGGPHHEQRKIERNPAQHTDVVGVRALQLRRRTPQGCWVEFELEVGGSGGEAEVVDADGLRGEDVEDGALGVDSHRRHQSPGAVSARHTTTPTAARAAPSSWRPRTPAGRKVYGHRHTSHSAGERCTPARC